MEQYGPDRGASGDQCDPADSAMSSIRSAIEALISASKCIPIKSETKGEACPPPLSAAPEDQSLLKESALTAGDSVLD